MIHFRCPHCGLETHVDVKFAGQSGPCAGCTQTVTVPNAPPPCESGPRKPFLPRWMTLALGLAASLLSLLILFAVFRQVIQPAGRAAQRRACQQRVERLIRAMYDYQADHGTFPPAWSVDEQGVPLHSWRVLLLPYLGPEAQAIYAQLSLREPWDSPHNQAFAGRVPDVLACPYDRPSSAGETSFCVPVGPEYAFRSGHGLDLSEITDDPSTTLLILEVHASGINWMRPADITSVELASGISSGVPGTVSGHHPGEAVMVGTCDGQARPLSVTTSPRVLHQMATVSGGESPQPPFDRQTH